MGRYLYFFITFDLDYLPKVQTSRGSNPQPFNHEQNIQCQGHLRGYITTEELQTKVSIECKLFCTICEHKMPANKQSEPLCKHDWCLMVSVIVLTMRLWLKLRTNLCLGWVYLGVLDGSVVYLKCQGQKMTMGLNKLDQTSPQDAQCVLQCCT